MLIRVIGRIKETTEDNILQSIEPKEEVYVWKVKYIRSEDVDDFEELEKKKTVIYFYSKPPLVIKEHPDSFFERWKEAVKEDQRKAEEDITLEIEEGDGEEEE